MRGWATSSWPGGTFECDTGGVGSWGPSAGVGYDTPDDLHDETSGETVEAADGGDGGVPGPKDGMAVGMSLAHAWLQVHEWP